MRRVLQQCRERPVELIYFSGPESGLTPITSKSLLDTLTGANATLLAYANKKIVELDTRHQTISKAIAELCVETISSQQIKKLSYYLDNWDSIDFDDKRKAADSPDKIIAALRERYFSFLQIKSYVVVQISENRFWLLTAQLQSVILVFERSKT